MEHGALTGTQKRSLIITGMHRSFTSLQAQILQGAGLYIGDDLIGPDTGNIQGHFESKVIVDFHMKMLQEINLFHAPWTSSAKGLKRMHTDPHLIEEARHLTAEYFNRSQFGWKDPRAALFLPLWHRAIPQAHFLFLVRHPMHCVQSLYNRQENKTGKSRMIARSWRFLQLWTLTNRCIIEFTRRHADRCFILLVPEDFTSVKSSRILQHTLSKTWGFDLTRLDQNKYFNPAMKSVKHIHNHIKGLYQIHPTARSIYKDIQLLKDGGN